MWHALCHNTGRETPSHNLDREPLHPAALDIRAPRRCLLAVRGPRVRDHTVVLLLRVSDGRARCELRNVHATLFRGCALPRTVCLRPDDSQRDGRAGRCENRWLLCSCLATRAAHRSAGHHCLVSHGNHQSFHRDARTTSCSRCADPAITACPAHRLTFLVSALEPEPSAPA
jgi:hypothetical protein